MRRLTRGITVVKDRSAANTHCPDGLERPPWLRLFEFGGIAVRTQERALGLIACMCLLGLLMAPSMASAQSPPPPPPLAPSKAAQPAAPVASPQPGVKTGAPTLPVKLPGTAGGALRRAVSDLVPSRCEDTNRSLWTTIVIADVGALVLLFLLFWFVARKGWMSGFARLLVVTLPFAIGAAVALTFIRPEAEVVLRCLTDPELMRHIALRAFQPWQIGLAFGFAPVFLLAIILKFFHGLFRR